MDACELAEAVRLLLDSSQRATERCWVPFLILAKASLDEAPCETVFHYRDTTDWSVEAREPGQ